MTTIAEDLKTTIDTDWNDGTVTMTTHVFMKTDPNTTDKSPPATPAANKATLIIMEGEGHAFRRSEGTDLVVYEGEMHAYTNTYTTMKLVLAELKQIADVLTTGTGDLSFTVPQILGEIMDGLYIATFRYKWEKVKART